MYGLPYEGTWQTDKDKLISCFKNALHYLAQTYNAPSGTAVEMPEMTMHQDIYYEAIKFIIGHELSHYLDPYMKSVISNRPPHGTGRHWIYGEIILTSRLRIVRT